jgi:hypothetical protein
VVGFTIGSRGKVPGKTCEKRRINNNNNTLSNTNYAFSPILVQLILKQFAGNVMISALISTPPPSSNVVSTLDLRGGPKLLGV